MIGDGGEIERVRAIAYKPFTLESIEGMFFPGTMRVGTLYEKYHPTVPVVPHVSLKWQPPEPLAEEPAVEVAAVEVPAEEAAHAEPPAEVAAEEPTQAEAPQEDEAGELTEAEAESVGMGLAEADSVAAPAPPPPPERIELGDLSAGEPLEVEGYTLTLENPYEGSVLTYRHDRGVTLLYIAVTAFMLGLAIRTYWPSYRVNLWIEETGAGAVGKLLFRATGMLGEPEVVEDELVEALSGDIAGPGSAPPAGAAPETTPTPDAPAQDAPTGGATPDEAWTPGTRPLRDALPDAPPPDTDESPPAS